MSPSTESLDVGVLARLWVAGVGAYGAKWSKFYGELPVDSSGLLTVAGSMWARGLAGFSRATILGALSRFVAEGEEWPPNLPQMRHACIGIPSANATRRELDTRDARRSPFAMLVLARLDYYRYRMADATTAERLFRDAYTDACQHVMRGGALPESAAEIVAPEPPPRTPASDETVAENMTRMHRALYAEGS